MVMISDGCLSRGTKRKLSQRTLLQLNFCSRAKVESHSTELGTAENIRIQSSSDSNSGDGTLSNLSDLGAKEDDKIRCKSPKSSDYVIYTDVVGSAETSTNDDKLNCIVNSPPSLSKMTKLDTSETGDDVDDVYGKALATYIVARRFGDKVDLNAGSTISLLRDPENAKDPYAIKVSTF